MLDRISIAGVKTTCSTPSDPLYTATTPALRVIESAALPLWADAKLVLQRIGLPRQRLIEQARAGHVRSVKFSETRQAARLYHTGDVLDAMDRLAAGAQPRRRTRARPPVPGTDM